MNIDARPDENNEDHIEILNLFIFKMFTKKKIFLQDVREDETGK